MAIGQDKLLVTPLQMATVAQTVANGGMRMEPRLVAQVVDPDGRTIDEPLPQEAERVMSEENANALAGMMQSVVEQGTGTAAQLEGVDVAGKTGTAEVGDGTDDLWFIGFTDKVAVVAMLERQTGGTGGANAAPIAAEVLKALGE
jgi:peptidoglycan glycosyltransferase